MYIMYVYTRLRACGTGSRGRPSGPGDICPSTYLRNQPVEDDFRRRGESERASEQEYQIWRKPRRGTSVTSPEKEIRGHSWLNSNNL